MNAPFLPYQETVIKDLRGSALLLELFLEWSLPTRPNLAGWEEYRMCGQRRWLSHNALQGMLEEFTTISGAPTATTHHSPAMPWEGVEQPPPHTHN